MACYEQFLEITRELGDRHGEGITLGNLGRLHIRQGHIFQGIGLMRDGSSKLNPDSKEAQIVKELSRN